MVRRPTKVSTSARAQTTDPASPAQAAVAAQATSVAAPPAAAEQATSATAPPAAAAQATSTAEQATSTAAPYGGQAGSSSQSSDAPVGAAPGSQAPYAGQERSYTPDSDAPAGAAPGSQAPYAGQERSYTPGSYSTPTRPADPAYGHPGPAQMPPPREPLKFPKPSGYDGPTPAYPILTEELGYSPGPFAGDGGGLAGVTSSGRGTALGPIVTKALRDVLGWQIKPNDAQGFVGALNQSFQLTTVEGHVEAKWTPRSYAVASDLSGGISGAQASIYTMSKTLLDQALLLLDGLYALDPAADAEYVAALKQVARSQFTQLGAELGALGGPKVARIHQYFQMLLGITIHIHHHPLRITFHLPPPLANPPPVPPWTDPDRILGTLGDLRDQLGLTEVESAGHRSFINTVDDEQNVTNFRILVDYTNSLLTSWQNNFQFFYATDTPFLGTQLVVISRQLGVVSEAVDEVRFVLDSVFMGTAERQTFLLSHLKDDTPGHGGTPLPPIFLESLLAWIQDFVTGEAPGIIQTGGKFALGEDFTDVIWQLYTYTHATYIFAQGHGPAFGTDRVLYSIRKLADKLYHLFKTARVVGVTYLPPR